MSTNLTNNFSDLIQNHRLAYYNYWLKNDTTEVTGGKKCVSIGYEEEWFKICKGNYDEKEYTDIPLIGYAQFCIYDDNDIDCDTRDQNIRIINSLIPYNNTYTITPMEIPSYSGVPYTLYNLVLEINFTLVNSWLVNNTDNRGFVLSVNYPNAKLLKYEYLLKSKNIDIASIINTQESYQITENDAYSSSQYDESSKIGFRKTFNISKNINLNAIPKLVGLYTTTSADKTLNDIYKSLGVLENNIQIMDDRIPSTIDMNNIPVGTAIPFGFDLMPAITITKSPADNTYGSVTTVNNLLLTLMTDSSSNLIPNFTTVSESGSYSSTSKTSFWKIFNIILLLVLLVLFVVYIIRKNKRK
jgi:hypothetical protein